MNTLARAATAQLFPDSHAYLALRDRWSQLMNSDRKQTLTAAHHLLYLALRGKDWRQAFRPPTDPRRLANGAFYNWALFRALGILHSPAHEAELLAPFEGQVSPPMLQTLRQLVGRPDLFAYAPNGFAPDRFPFDAYIPAREVSPHA